MTPTRIRTDRREAAWRSRSVSPLSAATLLLLVTMVLSSSTAAPSAMLGRTVDDRSGPVTSAQAEQAQRVTVSRRRVQHQDQQPAAPGWLSLIAPVCQVGHDLAPAGANVAHADHTRVRVALLDLPPPAIP